MDTLYFKKCWKHADKETRRAEYCLKCKMPFVDSHKCQKEVKYSYRYSCNQCGKTYSNNDHLMSHIKTEHEKQFDFVCSICGKGCATKIKLKMHISRCHSQVKCDICNKEIANINDLRTHKFKVHKDMTNVWLCKHCPKSVFFDESKHEKHMRDKH